MGNKKTVVVTGGAGLIGPSLIELLLPKYRVVSLDSYFIGKEENHIEGAKYIKGHTKDIESLLGDEKPAIIFHLGEYSRVEQSFDDAEFVWESNVEGTFRVLEYWRKRKCKLVYAGSSTKFADDGLGRNQSPYAWMKASNTELVNNYAKWFDLPYAITYFYNGYGPRELSEGPYASVIGRFKKQYFAGEPITVFGSGTQTRCFSHVNDIAAALASIMATKRAYGEIINLGSTEVISIRDLAEKIKQITKSKSRIVTVPYEKAYSETFEDMQKRLPDLSKAKKLIGYAPTYTLDQIIASML